MSNFQTKSNSQVSLEEISKRILLSNEAINMDPSDLYKVYVLAYLQYPSEEDYQSFLQKLEVDPNNYLTLIKSALVNLNGNKVNFADSATPLIDLTESLYVSYSSGRTKTTRLLIAANPDFLRGFIWNHGLGRIELFTDAKSRMKEAVDMNRDQFGQTSAGVNYQIKTKFFRRVINFSVKQSFFLSLLKSVIPMRVYDFMVTLFLGVINAKVKPNADKFNVVFYSQVFMNDYANWNRKTLSRIKMLVQETDVELYFTLHDDIVYRKPSYFPDKRLAEFLCVLDLARSARCIFVPSFAVKTVIAKHFEKNKPIVVLPFSGAHILAYFHEDTAESQRNPITFLHFLGNDPRKNSFRTFSALLTLAQKGYDFKLNVIGAKPESNSGVFSVILKLKEIGILTNFYSNLSEENLSLIYQQSDCLIYCSLDEGFGLPIAEAGEMGCAVITSNYGSMIEVGERYQNVSFINPYVTHEIEKALSELMDINFRRIRKHRVPITTWDSALLEVLKTMGHQR